MFKKLSQQDITYPSSKDVLAKTRLKKKKKDEIHFVSRYVRFDKLNMNGTPLIFFLIGTSISKPKQTTICEVPPHKNKREHQTINLSGKSGIYSDIYTLIMIYMDVKLASLAVL